MDKKHPEHRINLETPNTLGLKEELWEKKPVSFLVSEITLYGAVVSAIPLVLLVLAAPVSLSGAVLSSLAVAGINVGSHYLKKSIINKHWETQLNYRKEKVPALVEMFASNGLVIPDEDQLALTITMKTDFKAVTDEKIQYHAYGLVIDEKSINVSFFLTDFKAKEILLQSVFEARVESIVDSYEDENGKFATSELRDTFILGVRQALQ